MLHDQSENPEEHEEQEQAEEYDAHSQEGDTEAVGILTLQFGIFRFISLDEVLDAGGDVLGRFHTPLVIVTGVALIGCQRGNGDGVDEFYSVAVIETDPNGF